MPTELNSIAAKPLDELPANLTRREFAVYLRKSLRSADRMLATGAVRVVKVGKSVLIPRSELRRLLEG